jgi:hypothetical protein
MHTLWTTLTNEEKAAVAKTIDAKTLKAIKKLALCATCKEVLA